MTSFLFEIVLIHIFLYLAWKLPAQKEKKTRSDGKLIPRYMTGDFGNPIGLTLVTLAFGLLGPFKKISPLLPALVMALIITLLLHLIWKKDAKRRTVALYLRSGTATVAGRLHLLYVVFVSFITTLYLLSWGSTNTTSIILFSVGACFYAITVVIDKARGVI